MKGHWHSCWSQKSNLGSLTPECTSLSTMCPYYVSVYLRKDGNRHEDGQWWQNNNIKTESDENAMMWFNSMNLKKGREGGGGTEGEKKKNVLRTEDSKWSG